MKVSVLPNVVFSGNVIRHTGNTSTPVGIRTLTFMNTPITLDIPDIDAYGRRLSPPQIKQEIRSRLRQMIIDVVDTNLYKDIGVLVGAEGSPPEVIDIDDAPMYDEDDDRAWMAWLRTKIQATFTIITTSRSGNQIFFGQERVWEHSPIYNSLGKGSYYEGNDVDKSCAYDYLINKYSKNSGVKKFTTAYNTTGKRGDKTLGKDLVDYWVSLPLNEHKSIYEEWERRNRESILIRDIVSSKRKVYPLSEEDFALQDLEDDLWTMKFNNIDTTYTEKEKKETLSILELIKWCICSGVRIIVKDYNGGFYLGYNPDEYDTNHNNRAHKSAIAVRIEHRHAYFETDTKKIMSAVACNRNVNYEELRKKKKVYRLLF